MELRRSAAGTATGTLLLCAADSKDDAATLTAIAARYSDAGARVERASGKTAALAKALRAVHPAAVIATDAASAATRAAWIDAGRPEDCSTWRQTPTPSRCDSTCDPGARARSRWR